MSEPVVLERVTPGIERIERRTWFCSACDLMAVVSVGGEYMCREHAVVKLNDAHQAAVEAVNRMIRGES